MSQRIESKCLHKIEASRGSKKRRGKTSRDLLTRTRSDLSQQSNQIVLPAGRWNRHTLMSPCFQIVYKNEEVPLNELLRFKCHLLVQAGDCLAAITNSNFWLDIQLCFADCTHPPNSAQELQVVHTRSLQLHLDLCRGLHYHLPIMFDYFHLSSVTLSVHGSLTTLCLPYLSANALSSPQLETQQHESCSSSDTPVDPSQSKASPETGPKSRGVDSKRPPLIPLIGYDHLLFGCSFAQLDAQLQDSSQSNVIILRQRRSQLLHWQLCSLLCISLQSVRRKLHEFVKMLPPWQQNKHRKRVFGRLRLQSLSQLAQDCYRSCLENGPRAGNCDLLAFQNAHFAKRVQPTCELRLTSRTSNGLSVDTDATNVLQPEDYAARVGADLAYLCGCLIVMWQLLVRLVSHNERIAAHLAKVHHLHRCKRFSEAFLVKERTRNQMCAIYTSDQVAQVAELAEQLRKSEYLERLPRCAVECVTVDGDQSTLPIIFEERYQSTDLPVHDHSSLGLLDRAGASNDCDHHAKTVSSKNHNQQDNDKSSTATVHALQRKQIRRSMSDLSSSSSTGSNHTSSSGCCSSTGSATTARQLPFKFFSKKLGKTNSTLQKSWANKRKSLVEPLSSSPSSSSSLCNSVSSSLPIPSGPDGASNLINTSKELNSILTHKLLGVASDSEERSHSPQTLIRQLSTCSDRLISFRHYNNVRGELDEAKLLAANGCNRSLVHIVETVSLQNIKSGEDLQLIWSGSKRSSDSKPIDEGQAILNASESLPDLSVQRLQKNIRRLSRGGKRHTLSRIRLRSNDHPEKRRVKAIGRKWRESYSASPTNGQKHEMSNSSWNSIKDGATKMGKVTNKRKVRSAPADKLRLHFGSKSKENAGLVDQGKRSTCSPTIKAIFHMDRVDLDHDTCEVSSESQSDQSDYDDLPVFDDSDEDENEEGEGEGRSKRSAAIDLDNEKCTILDMFKLDACLLCGQISCDCGQNFEFTTGLKRLSMITNDLVSFVRAKEEFRQQLKLTSKGIVFVSKLYCFFIFKDKSKLTPSPS